MVKLSLKVMVITAVLIGMISVDALRCFKCDNCPGSTANKTNAPELITCPKTDYFCLRQELKTKINSDTIVRTIYMNCARVCIGGFVSNAGKNTVHNFCCYNDECNYDYMPDIY